MSNLLGSVARDWGKTGKVISPPMKIFSHRVSRHLYALYCLLQREMAAEADSLLSATRPNLPSSEHADGVTSGGLTSPSVNAKHKEKFRMPAIFTDPGWALLCTSIISTSNCGNPALRLFGFGPVAADGYGIGYIIKENGLSLCVPGCLHPLH